MFVDDGIRLIDIAIGHFPHTQDCPAFQFSAEISKIGTLIVDIAILLVFLCVFSYYAAMLDVCK